MIILIIKTKTVHGNKSGKVSFSMDWCLFSDVYSISPSNSVGVKVLINQQPTPFAAASYVLEQDESWRLRL